MSEEAGSRRCRKDDGSEKERNLISFPGTSSDMKLITAAVWQKGKTGLSKPFMSCQSDRSQSTCTGLKPAILKSVLVLNGSIESEFCK